MPPLAASALALLLSPAPAAPEGPPPATAPAEAVRAIVRGFPGQVRLFAKNLDTGASFGLGEDEIVWNVENPGLVVLSRLSLALLDGL